jgi:hypothetical protein
MKDIRPLKFVCSKLVKKTLSAELINPFTNNIVEPNLEMISSTSFSPIYAASSADIFTSATPKSLCGIPFTDKEEVC